MKLPLQGPPLDPDPDSARGLLSRELDKFEYALRRDWLGDALAWLGDLFQGRPRPVSGPGWVLVVVLILVIVAVVARFVWRARGSVTGGAARRRREGLIEPGVSASDYRRQAQDALDAGDPDTAVIAAYRSLVADLDARGLMGDVPARTAREAGTAIATSWPSTAREVLASASWFDRAAYGVTQAGHRTTLQQARAVLDLADRFAGRDQASTR